MAVKYLLIMINERVCPMDPKSHSIWTGIFSLKELIRGWPPGPSHSSVRALTTRLKMGLFANFRLLFWGDGNSTRKLISARTSEGCHFRYRAPSRETPRSTKRCVEKWTTSFSYIDLIKITILMMACFYLLFLGASSNPSNWPQTPPSALWANRAIDTPKLRKHPPQKVSVLKREKRAPNLPRSHS